MGICDGPAACVRGATAFSGVSGTAPKTVMKGRMNTMLGDAADNANVDGVTMSAGVNRTGGRAPRTGAPAASARGLQVSVLVQVRGNRGLGYMQGCQGGLVPPGNPSAPLACTD